MSDTCRLFPPFGDPWPSCLLPCHFHRLQSPGPSLQRLWKVCPFFLLENFRPLSPWGPLDFLSTCLGNDSLSRIGQTSLWIPRTFQCSVSLCSAGEENIENRTKPWLVNNRGRIKSKIICAKPPSPFFFLSKNKAIAVGSTNFFDTVPQKVLSRRDESVVELAL